MNNIIHIIRHTARAATVLLLALLTAQTAWAQSTETLGQYTFTVGTDDEGSYYAVDCEEALIGLSIYINYDRASGKRFKQTVDITMTGAKFNNSYFAPIGNGDNTYFSGTYDGGGHTISGLNVSHGTYAGLFGRVHGANLHDIVLVSPTVATSETKANTYVGPIVAFTKESSTQVSNCTVINPTFTLPDGFKGYAGAIVGRIYDGRATNCHFYGGNQSEAIGSNFGDSPVNVSRVYTLTATGCTATATPTVTVGTTSYYNSGTAVSLSHEDRDDYIFNGYTSNDVTITNGTFTMPDADVTITSTWTKKVQTGLISGTVTISDGASITLSDATITGGIVCDGSATITLVGTNSVSGASQKAGIQIGGSGTTLTIKGDGSLTANGDNQSAGIGLSRAWKPANDVIGGDIVIEGGNITANGGSQWGAGIGTGVIYYGDGSAKTARIGNITIKGGSVKATGGTSADGIGTGYTYNGCTNAIGTVTIYDGIDKVDASSIKNSGSIVYMHGETDVTASASTYFTIIEDGDRRIIEKKDDTDYTITIADDIEHGTLTGAATAKYGEKVTITVTPDFGYRLSRFVVKDADNNDVATAGNTFLMPKGNVTVSAVFEQGTHGTTEFAWSHELEQGYVTDATIYDGVTTVNLQVGPTYAIIKYEGSSQSEFLLDNNTYDADIPYSGGTGTFTKFDGATNFSLVYDDEVGFYDITMTDVGNGKWSVSILKTVGQMDNLPDQTYTGSEIKPEPLVLAGSLSLTKGTDYEYSYTNNTNVGTATVTVTFKGNYASIGSVAKTFTIVKATPTVTAPTPIENLVYSGSAQALVTAGSTDFGTLIYSTDGENYSADIPTATDAGTYTVYYKVVGSDNWNAVDVQTVSVTIAPGNYTVTFNANGGEGTMEPMQLTYGGDWTALPANTFTRSGYGFSGWNTEADGSGTPYRDEEWVKNLTTETSIVLYAQWGKDIATCTATVPDQTMGSYSYIYYKFETANYDPELAAAMGVVVKDGDEVLTLGTDYEFDNVTFADGSNGMPASIGDECLLEIKGKGNYAGSLWVPFTITVADAGGTWGELAWAFHAGTLTISGTGAMDAASDYSDYPWFSVASNVKTITIGEGVTTIADAAFAGTSQINYYSRVATASLPTTLAAIGDDAFAYCTGLTIAIPSGVTISSSAFYQVGRVVGTLSDAADNTDIIGIMAAAQSADVTLAGRTLYKDGSWNTLCLPFSISTASGTLSGDDVQAMTLNTTTSNLTGSTLTLNFTAAETIPAGTPFIIKWDESGTDITNPVFEGVTIDATNRDAPVEGVLTFTGTYAPVTTPATGDNTKLYLGADNKLFYPTKTMTIGTHRAYFQLLGDLTAGEPTSPQSSHVRAFNLNFGDNEATGIISVHDSGFTVNGSNAWYTLDGRRLDGQPTAKGLYINNGKKVAIK